jgi:hypothetical protein
MKAIEAKPMRASIKPRNSKIAMSGLRSGPLILPEGVSVDGSLILFAEDETYLHCVLSVTGAYYGVFKSNDKNHMYQQLLKVNPLENTHD